MIDAKIVRFFADNPDRLLHAYNLLDKQMFTRPSALLVDAMFQQAETHGSIDLESVVAQLLLKGLPASTFQEVRSLAEQAQSIESLDAEWQELAEQLSAREAAYKIAGIADKVVCGEGDLDEIKAVLERHDRLTEDVNLVNNALLNVSPLEAFEETYVADGMPWSLDFINRNIGPLRKGTFTVLGARPDSGKTTVMMGEAAHHIRNGQKVLWLNNEERDKKIYLRLIQSVLGLTIAEIRENPSMLEKFSQYDDLLHVANVRRMRPKDVESIIDEVQPDVVYFDQLYKLRGFNTKDNDAMRIHSLFIWARETAAEHDTAIITAHQADVEAAGKEFPEMHMLYMGKTGIQSEADTILMLGRGFDDPSGFTRGLTIAKTKEVMETADPIMRTYIEIDPFRVSIKEIDGD